MIGVNVKSMAHSEGVYKSLGIFDIQEGKKEECTMAILSGWSLLLNFVTFRRLLSKRPACITAESTWRNGRCCSKKIWSDGQSFDTQRNEP